MVGSVSICRPSMSMGSRPCLRASSDGRRSGSKSPIIAVPRSFTNSGFVRSSAPEKSANENYYNLSAPPFPIVFIIAERSRSSDSALEIAISSDANEINKDKQNEIDRYSYRGCVFGVFSFSFRYTRQKKNGRVLGVSIDEYLLRTCS